MWDAQQRTLRQQEARMWQAHAAARRPEAASAAAPPLDGDVTRRIDAIAEHYYAGPRRGPRIRGL
jgi:uncharacterized protein YbjT (DUF2867 family)